ncbi:MAG: O-antigen ligase family protein [Gammaproteobacteria bacterium]|nr:O-antigen ligase family protein [Gammaproteobacteria bacterium]
MVAGITLIMLVWVFGLLIGVVRWPRAIKKARWVLIPLGLFVFWVGVQALGPLIGGGWFIQSRPEAPPTGFFLGTVDRSGSADSLFLSVGLFLLAVLTMVLVRSRRRALLVLYTLVLAGLLQAIFGSLMTLSGVEFEWLDYRQLGRENAHGTFINRNHYANLLVLALSAGVGLLLAQMDLRGAPNLRQRLRSLLQAALGPKARLRVYMIIMVIALVLTHSRMGNAAFFASITLVGLFALWRQRKPSRPLIMLVISVLVIDIFVVGTWFGVEQVIDRVQQTVQGDGWQVNEKVRLDTSRESLDMIRKLPLTGYGGGTFYTAYPSWRGDDQQFMDHAHNDYLEFVVEYGLIGGVLLAWFLLVCLFRAATGLQNRDQAKQFGICFASLMAMVAMMIHATVDFSLQIPANAGWFVVLGLLPFTFDRSGERS